MSSQFITTKKVVNKALDGRGPEFIYMSVEPVDTGRIYLVIGAHFKNRCACSLSKRGVKELIDMLSEIHEAMGE